MLCRGNKVCCAPGRACSRSGASLDGVDARTDVQPTTRPAVGEPVMRSNAADLVGALVAAVGAGYVATDPDVTTEVRAGTPIPRPGQAPWSFTRVPH